MRAPTLGPPLLDHVTSDSVPRLAKLRFPQLQDGTTVSCISLAVVRIRWYHLCQVLRTVSNTQSVLATTIMIPANSGSLLVRTGHWRTPVCLPDSRVLVLLHSPALACPYVGSGGSLLEGTPQNKALSSSVQRHRHLRIFLAPKLTDAQTHKAPSPLPL